MVMNDLECWCSRGKSKQSFMPTVQACVAAKRLSGRERARLETQQRKTFVRGPPLQDPRRWFLKNFIFNVFLRLSRSWGILNKR